LTAGAAPVLGAKAGAMSANAASVFEYSTELEPVPGSFAQ